MPISKTTISIIIQLLFWIFLPVTGGATVDVFVNWISSVPVAAIVNDAASPTVFDPPFIEYDTSKFVPGAVSVTVYVHPVGKQLISTDSSFFNVKAAWLFVKVSFSAVPFPSSITAERYLLPVLFPVWEAVSHYSVLSQPVSFSWFIPASYQLR